MSSVLHDVILGSLTVSQCEANAYQPDIELTPQRVSGGVDPAGHFITSMMPKIVVTTTDIGTLFGSGGVLPAAGLSIASGTNVDMPLSRRADGSTRAGSTSHTRIRGATGAMAIPLRIQASQNSPFVTAEFEVNLLSADGLTIPVSIAVDQSLASQAITTSYRLGPCYGTKDGGSSVLVKGCTGWTVNPGIVLELRKVDGAIYPQAAFIKTRDPFIDLTFDDEEDLDVWCDQFNQMDAFTAYARKMVEGGTVVAAATAEHIGFSFADGVATCQGVSGSGTDTVQNTLRITGEALSVSVATAIPAA